MTNFKVGDKVKRVEYHHGGMVIGDIGTITELSSGGSSVRLKEFDAKAWHAQSSLEVVNIKSGKEVPEDLTRFIAFATGCNNMGQILLTEKQLKEDLKRRVNNSRWTGRIIGYKMIPILEAEQRTILKVFKRTKIKKTRRR